MATATYDRELTTATATYDRELQEQQNQRERSHWENHAGAIFQGFLWSFLLLTAAIACVFYLGFLLIR